MRRCVQSHAPQIGKAGPADLRVRRAGGEENRRARFRDNATSLAARSKWTLALGASRRLPVRLGLADLGTAACGGLSRRVQHQPGNRDYRIAITNKLYHDRQVRVRVTGLPAADYTLGAAQVDLPPAGHESVLLSLSDKLPQGYTPSPWK